MLGVSPRQAARRAVVAVLMVVLAVGCGDDSRDGTGGDAAAETTATTVPTFTLDELGAALPTEADLPDGYLLQSECRAAGAPDCDVETSSSHVSILAVTSGYDASIVRLVHNPDAATATAELTERRSKDAQVVGDFDIPVAEVDGGYTPGRRGHGTSEDVDIDGWSGYRVVAEHDNFHPDGTVDGNLVEVRIVVAHGNAVLDVQANSQAGTPPDQPAEAVADSMVRLVIDRLG